MTAMPACLMEGWCERKIPCGFTRQTPCLARHSWWDNSIDEIRREHRRHTSTLTRKMWAEGNAARGRCKLRAMRRRPPAYDTTVAISCDLPQGLPTSDDMSRKIILPIPHFVCSLATSIRTFQRALSIATDHCTVFDFVYRPLVTA
jgi:hypothetical protein